MNSLSVLAGSRGDVTSNHGLVVMVAIGTNRCAGSGSVRRLRIGSMIRLELESSSGYPSGGDIANTLVPIDVPPPGLLSMMKGWPSRDCRSCATSRASTSFGEPGVYGAMIL